MTVPTPEPNPNDGHPAWNEILELLPEEFQTLVKPKLEAWDKGVQEKITTLHSEYEPYKELKAQGADAQAIKNAVQLAKLFDQDPEALIRNAIEHYELQDALLDIFDFEDDDEDEDDEDEDNEGEENPPPKWAKQLNSRLTAQEQRAQEREAQIEQQQMIEALDNYLEELHEAYDTDEQGNDRIPFNDEFVLTLLASGMDGDDAVQQFYQYISNGGNQAGAPPASTTAPVVAGAGGTTGSGLPVERVKPGSLTNSQTDDLVEEILRKHFEQANQ